MEGKKGKDASIVQSGVELDIHSDIIGRDIIGGDKIVNINYGPLRRQAQGWLILTSFLSILATLCGVLLVSVLQLRALPPIPTDLLNSIVAGVSILITVLALYSSAFNIRKRSIERTKEKIELLRSFEKEFLNTVANDLEKFIVSGGPE